MTEAGRLTRATSRGVAYIQSQQQADGSFLTETQVEPAGFGRFDGEGIQYVTTFVTALILGALNELEGVSELDQVRQEAAIWLLAQRGESWTFNYWPRASAEARDRPYPDDWDDTACALIALQQYRPELVGPEVLAAVVRQLTVSESTVGGPYFTWLVPTVGFEQWQDVDVAVNCNVGYLLARQGVVLPRLVQLAETAIRAGAYRTSYYAVSAPAVMYFVARFYEGPLRKQLRRHVLERQVAPGWWGSDLDTALAGLALLKLGGGARDLELIVGRLLQEQQPDGGWLAAALYIDKAEQDETRFAGSRVLATAWVLEVLEGYRRSQELPAKAEPGEPGRALLVRTDVVKRVQQRLGRLEGELQKQAVAVLERQLERDRDGQIVLLPLVWEAALRPSLRWAGRECLVQFGMVSLYGWMSYTIYDDFLDDEGRPAELGVANVALRELTLILAQIGARAPEMPELVDEVLARVDAANTWEVMHCRMRQEGGRWFLNVIPDFGARLRLADRSLGHALGPLGLLLIRGYGINSEAVRLARKFFEHYLIVRQLNDDVHDWEMDLRRGQINVVGAWLLDQEEVSGALKAGVTVAELDELIIRLKSRLWQKGIETVAGWIFEQAAEARAALRANPVVRETAGLEIWLEPLEQSVREALAERERALAFIREYERNNGNKKDDAVPGEPGTA